MTLREAAAKTRESEDGEAPLQPCPAVPVPGRPVTAQVVLGQTAGPTPHRRVRQVGLLLLRLGQGAEQGQHVPVQCLWTAQTPQASLPACITRPSWQVSPVTSAPLIHPPQGNPRHEVGEEVGCQASKCGPSGRPPRSP